MSLDVRFRRGRCPHRPLIHFKKKLMNNEITSLMNNFLSSSGFPLKLSFVPANIFLFSVENTIKRKGMRRLI